MEDELLINFVYLPLGEFFLYNKQMKRIILAFFMTIMLLSAPMSAEASFFSNALAKARSVMQGAFQMTFLPSVPVIFYKSSFNRLFDHATRSIDNIQLEHNGQTITRDKFQDDKALHIKKSAELALHIKSLIGSAHLAYGITMAIGVIKEAIDGSFLNPNGSRSKEDLSADHVGAMAVFGEDKFNNALRKKLDQFIVAPAQTSSHSSNITSAEATEVSNIEETEPADSVAAQEEEIVVQDHMQPPTAEDAVNRQQLITEYYKAVNSGDTEKIKQLGSLLQK